MTSIAIITTLEIGKADKRVASPSTVFGVTTLETPDLRRSQKTETSLVRRSRILPTLDLVRDFAIFHQRREVCLGNHRCKQRLHRIQVCT